MFEFYLENSAVEVNFTLKKNNRNKDVHHSITNPTEKKRP